MKAHAAAEEETFYAKLMESRAHRTTPRHSVSEHKEMDNIMEELNSMGLDNSGWLTRFKTLKHDYEHHMDEEEEEIFAKAREVLKDDLDSRHAENFRSRKAAERNLVNEESGGEPRGIIAADPFPLPNRCAVCFTPRMLILAKIIHFLCFSVGIGGGAAAALIGHPGERRAARRRAGAARRAEDAGTHRLRRDRVVVVDRAST